MNNKAKTQTQNNSITKRAFELENGILLAFIALDRAKQLIDDTVDEFFNAHNTDDKNSHSAIIYDFNRYRVYVECVDMLVSDAYFELQKLGAARFVK